MSLNDPRVLLLATTTAERTPYIEGLPTMKEMGYPVYAESWLGILAPANTPDPVVAKLEAGIQKIMETKEAQDAIKSLQVTRMKGTGKDFGVFLSQERKKWGDVIKSANITLE